MSRAAEPPRATGHRSLLSGLAARQALITLLIALAFSAIGSAIELFLDWRAKRADVSDNIAQVMAIAHPSAAEAAYLLNEQLAKRVVSGLIGYASVRSATLLDDRGEVLATAVDVHEREDTPLAQRLFGDLTVHHTALAHDDMIVGDLTLELSASALSDGFVARIADIAGLTLLRALAICALVVVFFYGMIIRPLERLSRQVDALDPAHPGAAPLPPARGHERDEIGTLISALNSLLTAFQRGLDQRDRAEAELTALTHELEQRVEQRTEALVAAKHEIEELNKKLTSENLRMGAELDVSRKIQRMTLPTPDEIADLPGLDVATYMESANEVGGDYYDILRSPDSLRISIGDVTGHGLESGVVMLMTQSAVRTLTTGAKDDLSQTLQVLNRTIYNNVQRMGSDKNLTLALLDYRLENGGGHLRIGGQHESVIVVRRHGTLEVLDTTELGMPLGLLDEVGDYLGEIELSLQPHDVVVLFTDGITEAADIDHRLYGQDRLCEVIMAHRAQSAEAIKQAVINDVMNHIGNQTIYDDLTLIVLKQKEPPL